MPDTAHDPFEGIRSSFRGIEPLRGSELLEVELVTLVRGINNPPAYMVRILLLNVLGLFDLGPGEKTRWQTQFKYKGLRFLVRDSEFGWAIESDSEKGKTASLALEILAKITKATAALDKSLHPYLRRKVKNGEFYLKNEYRRLFSIYEFFKRKAMTSAKLKRRWRTSRSMSGRESARIFARDIDMVLSREIRYDNGISNYSFAMVVAFFSLQEHILDVFYAFIKDGAGFLDFMQSGRWREKFLAVFGPLQVKGLNEIYEGLLKAREGYRNSLAHGLADWPGVMVPLPGLGLVPLSLDYLGGSPHYSLFPVGEDDAMKMKDVFERFLRIISMTNPWRFYLLYLESGLPIPATKIELTRIKNEMTTYHHFRGYIEARVMEAEAVANYDVT
jgi:hypothetical protein